MQCLSRVGTNSMRGLAGPHGSSTYPYAGLRGLVRARQKKKFGRPVSLCHLGGVSAGLVQEGCGCGNPPRRPTVYTSSEGVRLRGRRSSGSASGSVATDH